MAKVLPAAISIDPMSLHPLFGHFLSASANDAPEQADIFVNGQPANRYANARRELAEHGFRYVVFHKPQDSLSRLSARAIGERQPPKNLLTRSVDQQPPLVG